MAGNMFRSRKSSTSDPVNPPNAPRLVTRSTLLRDVVEIVLLVVTIYTLVNLATARAVVEGASMQPNFFTGQLIVVNRFTYYFMPPQRGEVIVLHDPEDPSQDFIKRVVGLPGERVQITEEGRVLINGTMLDEPYINHFCVSLCKGSWQLDADHYFVLGDNRANSHDSHAFGPLDRKLIVGEAWIRYWPPEVVGMLPRPNYGAINATPPIETPTPTPQFTPIQRAPLMPGSPMTPSGSRKLGGAGV